MIKLRFNNTDQINHPISFLFKGPITSWILYGTRKEQTQVQFTALALLVRSCSQLFLSTWQRIQYFGSETVLAIIAKQSVTFLLELNHNTLTIWYQTDQCHFACTAESLVWYLKRCSLLTQSIIFSTSCRLQINGRKAFHGTFQFNIL